MKQGWEIKKLGELVNIKTGKLDSNAMVEGGQYPFFTCSREIFAIDKYAFDCEAILLAGNNASGDFNVKHYKGKFNAYQRTYVITIREENKILYSYLNLQLINHLKKFKEQSVGANTKFLKIGMIQEMDIPLPPLPVQQRIVSILDQTFSAIERSRNNAEQNLKNAKELFESYLQGVFEQKGDVWKHTRLGDICQINDGTHFSPKNGNDGEYKYITAKNIKPYYIDLSNISYISKKDHKEIYSRCSPKKGDVLYIKDGATAGIATINSIEEEFSLLSSVALLKCSNKILNTFLVHYMNGIIGKKNFLGYIDGAAITRLTLVKIKNVCFPIPTIEEQHTIVRQLDALRAETQKLETIYQQKLLNLEELKKSILQKAFSGEL